MKNLKDLLKEVIESNGEEIKDTSELVKKCKEVDPSLREEEILNGLNEIAEDELEMISGGVSVSGKIKSLMLAGSILMGLGASAPSTFASSKPSVSTSSTITTSAKSKSSENSDTNKKIE